MEKFIEMGFPIIFENIGETIDSVFNPILDKKITISAGMKKIKWGDTDISYHDDFKFYMTTKLPNPHYSPELCVKITLINFTVTEVGLIDQVKGILIQFEKEADYITRQKSIKRNEQNKVAKKNLEVAILTALDNAGDNILDDDDAVAILEKSRVESKNFKLQEDQFEFQNKKYQKIQKIYEKLAARISILFFAVNDLQGVEKMYQFSLEYFLNLFKGSIRDSDADADEI